jgi:hypothetical protein
VQPPRPRPNCRTLVGHITLKTTSYHGRLSGHYAAPPAQTRRRGRMSPCSVSHRLPGVQRSSPMRSPASPMSAHAMPCLHGDLCERAALHGQHTVTPMRAQVTLFSMPRSPHRTASQLPAVGAGLAGGAGIHARCLEPCYGVAWARDRALRLQHDPSSRNGRVHGAWGPCGRVGRAGGSITAVCSGASSDGSGNPVKGFGR